MLGDTELKKLNLECPNCHQKKEFDAINGHANRIHTVMLKCKNPKCKMEFVISDGEVIPQERLKRK